MDQLLKARLEQFVSTLLDWLETQDLIQAALIVGSYARGAARLDSDIDVVLLCRDFQAYLENSEWPLHFGKPLTVSHEDYGKLTSVRVHYEDFTEVEFGFTTTDWISTPLDRGTATVIRGGHLVVYDPSSEVTELLQKELRVESLDCFPWLSSIIFLN
jgi:predicted nucleotidyltransferase